MLNGVEIKIRMTRGKDELCLMRDDGIAYKLNIVSASFFFFLSYGFAGCSVRKRAGSSIDHG